MGRKVPECLTPRLRWKTEETNEPGKQRILRLARRMHSRPLRKNGIPLDLNIDLRLAGIQAFPFGIWSTCFTVGGIRSAKRQAESLARRKKLVEVLKDDACTYSVANFLKVLNDFESQNGEALHGVRITEDKVSFCGFPVAPDKAHL